MDALSYVDPELFVIVPLLYAVGAAIKKSPINDSLIPFILAFVGILLAAAHTLSTAIPADTQELLCAIYRILTQGLLCASASVYANNIVKQVKSKDGNETDTLDSGKTG
ncbi:MAG: phage holin family protein [Clostridia bacterium]|nr:phage holin family protein [Clostridia bacterium]